MSIYPEPDILLRIFLLFMPVDEIERQNFLDEYEKILITEISNHSLEINRENLSRDLKLVIEWGAMKIQ